MTPINHVLSFGVLVAFIGPPHLGGDLSLICGVEKIGQLTVKNICKMAFFPSTFITVMFLMQNL